MLHPRHCPRVGVVVRPAHIQHLCGSEGQQLLRWWAARPPTHWLPCPCPLCKPHVRAWPHPHPPNTPPPHPPTALCWPTCGVAAAQRLLVHGRLGKLRAAAPLVPEGGWAPGAGQARASLSGRCSTRVGSRQPVHPVHPAVDVQLCRRDLRGQRQAHDLPASHTIQTVKIPPAGVFVRASGAGAGRCPLHGLQHGHVPFPSPPDKGKRLGRHQVHALQGAPLGKVVPHNLAQLHSRSAGSRAGGQTGTAAALTTAPGPHAGGRGRRGSAQQAVQLCTGEAAARGESSGLAGGRAHPIPPGQQAACRHLHSARTECGTPARMSPRLPGTEQHGAHEWTKNTAGSDVRAAAAGFVIQTSAGAHPQGRSSPQRIRTGTPGLPMAPAPGGPAPWAALAAALPPRGMLPRHASPAPHAWRSPPRPHPSSGCRAPLAGAPCQRCRAHSLSCAAPHRGPWARGAGSCSRRRGGCSRRGARALGACMRARRRGAVAGGRGCTGRSQRQGCQPTGLPVLRAPSMQP